MFNAKSILLPITLAAMLAGCFADDKNNGSDTVDAGGDTPVDPNPGNGSHNPFINMKSENYRLSANLGTIPAVKTGNDKVTISATITPIYQPPGEAN